MREIRLIDTGPASALRSHALYHGLTSGVSGDQPDTLVLSVPTQYYVSLGCYEECFHQTNIEYCREKGIPVLRRQIGGGAHVLGPDQLLFQTVFHARRSAKSATRMYHGILRVAVETYRDFGVDAHYLPFTDIRVGRSRISAGSLGRLNESVVLASSLAYGNDPDIERAALTGHARVETTSMQRELGSPPDREAVKARFLENFVRNLEARLVPGFLTEEERAELERLEEVLSSPEWLGQADERVRQVKEWDASDEVVRVAEGQHVTTDGVAIRATVRVSTGTVDDLALTGNFLFYKDHLSELADSFRGATAEWDALMTVAENFYLVHQVDCPGVTPHDWVRAIHNALTGSSSDEPAAR